jgi:hypothetical protein
VPVVDAADDMPPEIDHTDQSVPWLE